MLAAARQNLNEFTQEINDVLALPELQEFDNWNTMCSQMIYTDHPLLFTEEDRTIIVYLHPFSSKPNRLRKHLVRTENIENNLTDCLRFQTHNKTPVGTFHQDINKQARVTNSEYLAGLRIESGQTVQGYSQTCMIPDNSRKIEQLKQLQERLTTIRQGMNHRLLSRQKNKSIRESLRRTETKLHDLTGIIEEKVKNKRRVEQLLITHFTPARRDTEHHIQPLGQRDQNDDFRDSSD